ncbi:MAG: hypothetical protein PVH03_14950, partial [Chloroflexota bacterium]
NSLEETGFVPLDHTEETAMADMKTVYRQPSYDSTFRSSALATEADYFPEQTRQGDRGTDTYFKIQDQNEGIDWTAVVLSIIALISLLGLIPLWYLVYLRFNG